MKKLFSVLLALITLISLFAACGKKEPVSAENATVLGTIDMTDNYTLVIEETGTKGDERTGVRAAEGKIEVGIYNSAGTERVKGIEFDFKELGLDGEPWEYLGAVVEVDESKDKPEIISIPDKCTFCVRRDELTLDEEANTVTVRGVTFVIPELNYGWLRTKTLLNEGGEYIPNWNDHSTITNTHSFMFNDEKYTSDYYFFVKCPLYNQTLIANYAEAGAADKELPSGIAPVE